MSERANELTRHILNRYLTLAETLEVLREREPEVCKELREWAEAVGYLGE